jgi:hypothetical protein
MDRWNIIPHCPFNLYEVHITNSVSFPPTIPMIYGSYFESKVLGTTANKMSIIDLPRKSLTAKQERENLIRIHEGKEPLKGKKKIDHIRIDQQVETAFHVANQLGMTILENYNTQVRIFKKIKNTDWVLRGTLDLFPTPITLNNEHPVTGKKTNISLVDLKLTGDLDRRIKTGTIWNIGRTIDFTQLYLYAYLLQDIDFQLNDKINPGNKLRDIISSFIQMLAENFMIPVYYWIFEYKNPALRNVLKESLFTPMAKKEIEELIRKAISELDEMERNGYPTMPSYTVCMDCPITNCSVRETIERV